MNTKHNKTFVNWIITNYKNDDSFNGDIARDIIEDKKKNKWFKTSYNALRDRVEDLSNKNSILLNKIDELFELYNNSN